MKTGKKPAKTTARPTREDSSLDSLLSRVEIPGPSSPPAGLPGPVVARVAGLDAQGRPLVEFPGSPASRPSAARSTIPVTLRETGREVLVFFENGDRSLPIITGLLEIPGFDLHRTAGKISLQAEQELVLKCGPASLTLTRDGRVVLRGADVVSRSSGSNRIKGGSVHIN